MHSSGGDKSLAPRGRKQSRKPISDGRDLNKIETRAAIKFLFLQGKVPKEIHAFLTETLACSLPGRFKDLSALLYWKLYVIRLYFHSSLEIKCDKCMHFIYIELIIYNILSDLFIKYYFITQFCIYRNTRLWESSKINVKVNLTLEPAQRPMEVDVWLFSFFYIGSRWGGWSTPGHGRFTSVKDLVPILQEAGRTPWTFWTVVENLATTGIGFPNRPVCSQPLYRLSNPGPPF
jgi:hypothetical protein